MKETRHVDLPVETVAGAKEGLKKPATVKDVLKAVALAHDVTIAQLASPDKARRLCEARALAAVIIRDETPHLTLVSLARALNRDVSGLSHFVARTRNRLRYDILFRRRAEMTKRIFKDLTG